MYKHLDIDSLINLEVIDPDLTSQLMTIFLSEFPDHIKSIQKLACEKNNYELGRCIHSLKGSISIFGCVELCKLLKQIEILAKAEKFEETSEVYSAVKKQIDEFVEEVQIFIQNQKDAAA